MEAIAALASGFALMSNYLLLMNSTLDAESRKPS